MTAKDILHTLLALCAVWIFVLVLGWQVYETGLVLTEWWHVNFEVRRPFKDIYEGYEMWR